MCSSKLFTFCVNAMRSCKALFLKVNESWYKQCGVTPPFPPDKIYWKKYWEKINIDIINWKKTFWLICWLILISWGDLSSTIVLINGFFSCRNHQWINFWSDFCFLIFSTMDRVEKRANLQSYTEKIKKRTHAMYGLC